MRIYTKTGDNGTTGLVGGRRLPKANPLFEAIGDVDELNASLGLCRSIGVVPELDAKLEEIQSRLFEIGGELASPDEGRHAVRTLNDLHVEALERSIDEMSGTLPPLRNFILPGGSPLAAHLHLARSICRRAERHILGLPNVQATRGVILIYLNRLSDWLFTAARTANHLAHVEDTKWTSEEC